MMFIQDFFCSPLVLEKLSKRTWRRQAGYILPVTEIIPPDFSPLCRAFFAMVSHAHQKETQ